jgi:hypothetical protein
LFVCLFVCSFVCFVVRYNAHYYRAMWERLPFGGALQRAALRTYSGIAGHMAMPDNAEEQAVIAEVALSGRYESGFSTKSNEGKVWVPVVASGTIGKSSPNFQSLGRSCVSSQFTLQLLVGSQRNSSFLELIDRAMC